MSFSFHANTLAFGGQLEEEGCAKRFLPSQASVTLPPEGGFGESAISNYCENGISFYRAESRVFGNSFENRLFKTYANVAIYGLDIAGVLQADVLSASIISINVRNQGRTSESSISFDANIVGLVVDGLPYDVQLDTAPFRDHGTFSAFKNAFSSMKEESVVRARAEAYNWPFEECRTLAAVREEGGSEQVSFHVPHRYNTGLRATLLSGIVPVFQPVIDGETPPPPLKRRGFTIEVPKLGLVHLAEVLLTTGRRGINLLRVELGKTLDEPIEHSDAQPPSTGENRLRAVGIDETLMLAAEGPLSGGGYTVAHAVGNGTDFGPP